MGNQIPVHQNRLAKETSPYLLQHKNNPVDWYPWGEEALTHAKTLDRPILLSIGYSACHWCHVMERESFENNEIASLMNKKFVNIKVDREERPDIDSIYMNYVQMTTGSGGWPLTVFLTPTGVPFFGGTYFPPTDHFGRPGFPRVLESAATAFKERRIELEKTSPEIVKQLEKSSSLEVSGGHLAAEILEKAVSQMSRSFDPKYGGFGGAPKFPQAMSLGFLIRNHCRTGNPDILPMVELTLGEMARGGIFDQVGGGFHRYSVDERWFAPHFEKMLYDNALLVCIYLEIYQVTGSTFWHEIVIRTLDFLLREMMGKEGGFYSALDADSEGKEGRFYVWLEEEIKQVLGSSAAEFCDYYSVSMKGNFEGTNILYARTDLQSMAKQLGLSEEEFEKTLTAKRKELFVVREKRIRPGLDDKVLTAWNGLTLTAFARAGFVLGSDIYLESAIKNAEFLEREMIKEGQIHRTWKNGTARLNGYLEDYAASIEGFLSLFEASGEIRWLRLAIELMDRTIELFWDDDNNSFFFTSHDHEQLVVRQKEYMDNATPSGNSTCCLNLQRLGWLLERSDYLELAKRQLEGMSHALGRHPLAFGNWLQALDFHFGPVTEVTVVGYESWNDPLFELLRNRFFPAKVFVPVSSLEPSEELMRMVPFSMGKQALNGMTTVYICRDSVCSSPLTNCTELENYLNSIE